MRASENRAKQGAKGRAIWACDSQPIETWLGQPEAAQFCSIIVLFPPSNGCSNSIGTVLGAMKFDDEPDYREIVGEDVDE
jgi:hypothetical protein